MTTGLVHSIDTFSTLDGPGIRTVVFLQGCHLRCKYCHNPDSWEIDSPAAREYSVEELLAIIRRGQPYFAASGGGVTFSGGEPLLQYHFVAEVFQGCQEEGINTAFDSSLYVSPDSLLTVLPFTDLVLADIKQMHPQKSRELTGAGNEMNLHNLALINQHGIPIWIRYVLVPGFTDDREDVEAMAGFIRSLGQVKRVDLLPYHPLGQHKWQLLGLDYELTATTPPAEKDLEDTRHLITSVSGKPVYV